MRASTDNLTPKQTAAVRALLASVTLEEAARKVGVASCTITRWMKLPAFRQALSAERARLLEGCVNLLHTGARHAIEALLRGLKAEREADQLRAAALLLDNLFRGRELLDVNEKIAELTALIEELRRERQTPR